MYFDLDKYKDEYINCPWCGQDTRLEYIKGHYECLSCKRSVLDACEDELE